MQAKSQKIEGALALLERLFKGAALLGGLALFAVMLLVSAAVFFRYVLNEPILGDQELVEIGMALIVMLAMPFTAWKNAHIRVDILDDHLGSKGRFIGDIFARLVSIFALYLLVRKAIDKAFDAHRYNDLTNMIEIPVWIAYSAISAGMGLFAVVLVIQLLLQIQQGWTNYE